MTSLSKNGPRSEKHSFVRTMLIVLAATAAILAAQAIAMQFTDEVNWGLFDFVAAAVLLLGTGLAYAVVASKVRTARHRLIAGAVLGLVLLLVWVELAVGIFD